MYRRSILTLPLGLLTVGCASTGPRFNGLQPPTAGNARVYILRPSKMFQQGSYVGVRIGDTLMATLKNGTFCSLDLAPTSHQVEFSVDGNPLCLDCKGKGPTFLNTTIGPLSSGKTSFLGLNLFAPTSQFINASGTPIFLSSLAGTLIPLQEDVALPELRELNLAI